MPLLLFYLCLFSYSACSLTDTTKSKEEKIELSMMVHACDPSIWEVEAEAQDQFVILSELEASMHTT